MDTNGHEWQKQELTTKNTKKKTGESKNHEWTRIDTNRQRQGLTTKNTKYTKREGRGESKNHEWTRMTKEISNHEKYEKHEKESKGE